MRGIVISVIGTSVIAYMTFYSILGLPPEGSGKVLAIIGLVTLSIVVSCATNYIAFDRLRGTEKRLSETETLYRTLESRIRALVLTGLEDVLKIRVRDPQLPKDKLPLKFYVFTEIDGLYRVVASTVERDAQVRRLELEPDEGVVGVTVENKISGLARISDGEGDVFDRSGRVITQQRRLRDVNAGKVDVDLKWIYTLPIFEKSQDTPWSNRIIGVLTVDSSDDQGGNLFKDVNFQAAVEAIASDVSPYIDVLQSLITRGQP